MELSKSRQTRQLVVAAIAAFCTYFCMYAFRKPFTAGTFEGQDIQGLGLKTVLVVAQLIGYMVSKFIGIKVVSEMKSRYRAWAIVALILFAQLALVGFAYLPISLKPLMLFLNGLPLGMIFGLVLGYLEGRRHTEALSATLCASFIVSSGVMKSVGRWLVLEQGVSEFRMPMCAGFLFLPPLLVAVWALQRTPPPSEQDRQLRTERCEMSGAERTQFFAAYWPGLSLLVLVYVAITVVRTIRDDFGVEIWRDMGVEKQPSVFATSETLVALCVTLLNGLAVCVIHNLTALRATVFLMSTGFLLAATSALLQASSTISPYGFMVMCGVGMYVPYVAFHTTVFERLIAISRHPCNLGFLMYLADAIGYLGYAVVLVFRSKLESPTALLPFFRNSLVLVSGASILGLIWALLYFQRVLRQESRAETPLSSGLPAHSGE